MNACDLHQNGPSVGRELLVALLAPMRTITWYWAWVAILAGSAAAHPLTVPFDFSRHALGLSVTVKGKPLYMLLDTGVDPSVVDRKTAEQLGLPLDRKHAGEGSGEGSGKAEAVPSIIRDIRIGTGAFPDVRALATDMSNMSLVYRRPLNGVLGYSFLKDKTVLIDYPAKTVTIYSGGKVALAQSACHKHYAAPMRFLGDEHFPLMPDLRFGMLQVPATLDTGSNRAIGLYQAALRNKTLRNSLSITGQSTGAGFRGVFESQTAKLKVPVNVGPFRLPPGLAVQTISGTGSRAQLANVGNQTFAAMKAKLLLDYSGKRVSIYADCR